MKFILMIFWSVFLSSTLASALTPLISVKKFKKLKKEVQKEYIRGVQTAFYKFEINQNIVLVNNDLKKDHSILKFLLEEAHAHNPDYCTVGGAELRPYHKGEKKNNIHRCPTTNNHCSKETLTNNSLSSDTALKDTFQCGEAFGKACVLIKNKSTGRRDISKRCFDSEPAKNMTGEQYAGVYDNISKAYKNTCEGKQANKVGCNLFTNQVEKLAKLLPDYFIKNPGVDFAEAKRRAENLKNPMNKWEALIETMSKVCGSTGNANGDKTNIETNKKKVFKERFKGCKDDDSSASNKYKEKISEETVSEYLNQSANEVEDSLKFNYSQNLFYDSFGVDITSAKHLFCDDNPSEIERARNYHNVQAKILTLGSSVSDLKNITAEDRVRDIFSNEMGVSDYKVTPPYKFVHHTGLEKEEADEYFKKHSEYSKNYKQFSQCLMQGLRLIPEGQNGNDRCNLETISKKGNKLDDIILKDIEGQSGLVQRFPAYVEYNNGDKAEIIYTKKVTGGGFSAPDTDPITNLLLIRGGNLVRDDGANSANFMKSYTRYNCNFDRDFDSSSPSGESAK